MPLPDAFGVGEFPTSPYNRPSKGSTVKECVSIAIETSCRKGGVALGLGDRIVAAADFDASTRHAAQLITRMDELLKDRDLRPGDLDHVYVSVGPGSFTGTRIGVTVARTLAQAVEKVRCVAVSTPVAIAQNAAELSWQHLAVVLDVRDSLIYARTFTRKDGRIEPADEGRVVSAEEFLAAAPRPLTLIGEGLSYHDLLVESVTIPAADETSLHMPNAESLWQVGHAKAAAGEFTDYRQLLPVYARKPQAQRLWERRNDP